ncbi:MAG: GNAT family N-acetyltransferase [Clostridia bacterium]|nr:GNAT family N-acetyltransferase [Clostridia bacterium]
MSQLKMYWFPGTPIQEYELPEGYSFSKYKHIADRDAWVEICKNGLVGEGLEGFRRFGDDVIGRVDIDPERDIFFLDYKGEHIGTVTAFVHADDNTGDVHMVSIRTDFRRKGLSKYLTMVALKHLSQYDIKFAHLTTNEWRKAAVTGYLNAGFKPVEYDIGMEERWAQVLEERNIDSVEMYYEDGTFYKNIVRASLLKKVKFGVFGAGRGTTMMEYCRISENAELVAICDKYLPALNEKKEQFGEENIAYYTDFDEFLKHDMDAVVLANRANEHAPFAVKALKAGKNVFSELLPCQNMKEAVELIEAVEETGLVYAYAENCCYMPAPRMMRKLYNEGRLGKFEYGEGEYMHNCESIWHNCTRGEEDHWRNTMSAFYYCTHSLGPLVHITGMRPVKVSGFEMPFNDRMWRMGAKAGAMAIEIVTLEDGTVLKSLHGVGPSKSSLWFSVYGSKGRVESAREDDTTKKAVQTVYTNLDEFDGENRNRPEIADADDDLSEKARGFDHGGSDYYTMYNMVQRVRGNKNAEIIDIYEALDMFLPGYFGLLSAMQGGVPVEIPDLRKKEERDRWRNDTRCTDPANPGYEVIPSYTKGNPDIPRENYDRLRKLWQDGVKLNTDVRMKRE